MKKTTNYNLAKPDQEDFYNVDDFNGNMDIIDQALGNTEGLDEIKEKVTNINNNVGTTTDPAGTTTTGTVMGKLNNLLSNWTVGKIALLDTIRNLIGNPNDGTTVGTVMGKLNRMISADAVAGSAQTKKFTEFVAGRTETNCGIDAAITITGAGKVTFRTDSSDSRIKYLYVSIDGGAWAQLIGELNEYLGTYFLKTVCVFMGID